MFSPAHLRAPGRDRAILDRVPRGHRRAGLARTLVVGGLPVRALPAPRGRWRGQHSVAVGAIAFTLGWTLMIVAMMLPSSVPLVVTFAALVGRRARPGQLVVLLLLGYLLVWGAFGFAAWAADRGVHAAVDALPWLAAHPQLILGATLLGAGLWQFSPLRDRCLDECRSPLGFVLNRWRGVSERREALAMGLAHGAFCVGCCWSLMLVMFGVGIGSLTAMLVLGAVTAIEKNLPRVGGSLARLASCSSSPPCTWSPRDAGSRASAVVCSARGWIRPRPTAEPRRAPRAGDAPTPAPRSSRRREAACSPTAMPTSRPAAWRMRRRSRSARSTTTSDRSASSSWRSSRPRTRACWNASATMFDAPEPLWGRGSAPATSSTPTSIRATSGSSRR